MMQHTNKLGPTVGAEVSKCKGFALARCLAALLLSGTLAGGFGCSAAAAAGGSVWSLRNRNIQRLSTFQRECRVNPVA